jgi:hypothetical protein
MRGPCALVGDAGTALTRYARRWALFTFIAPMRALDTSPGAASEDLPWVGCRRCPLVVRSRHCDNHGDHVTAD